MSTKFTRFHQGTRHVWTNTVLTMETEVVFNRDISITDVSYVGHQTRSYFAIAENASRKILAYALVPAGDSKTRLTVKGEGKLILKANTTYLFVRWHASAGDIGWGNGVPTGPVSLGDGITATFKAAHGTVSANLNNPAGLTNLLVRNNDRNEEFGIKYSTIPYFWWEEVVNPPSKPSTITVPKDAQVGRNVRVSWSSVPFPEQPKGVNLHDRHVYYEVDFFNGEKHINVASKTSANSLSYCIPNMPDRTNATFRVRAFIEANGARYYGEYRESSQIRVKNNAPPTTPGVFTYPIWSSNFTVGKNYTVSWGVSTDSDGDTVTYDLDYFDGVKWHRVLKNGQASNRTFHVPCGPNTAKAQFRVRATDGKEYSAYRYSDQFHVEQNLVPHSPGPFTMPEPDEMRYVEWKYWVEWGEVENPQKEDIRYEVQFRPRVTDNWTTIRNVNNPYAREAWLEHTIPNVQDSANPQYRVRAYDGLDFGDWTESSYFRITGNRAINTKGFLTEIKPRYSVNQEVRLSWSAGSTVRNSAVLYDFEIFDGFNWREVMYDLEEASIIFRIPKMSDTSRARFRVRTKTRYDYGGFIYSDWYESRKFTVLSFFKFDNIVLPFPTDIQKKENVDYLRQLVNEMRNMNEIPPMVFADEIIVRYDTVMKNIHFDEIEQGILDCYDTNPSGRFNNSKTEAEMRTPKLYNNQQELLMDLPDRLTHICHALMNI